MVTRTRARPVGMAALVVAAMALVIALGPLVAPHSATTPVDRPFAPPGAAGLLGSDRLGRDVWSRILYGGRPVLLVPLGATVIATITGVPVGIWRGGRDGRVRWWGPRPLDVAIAIPPVVVLLVVLSRVSDSRIAMALIVGLVSVPFAARFARAAADPIWRRAHVEQAVLRGERRAWIAVHEVAPAVVGPIVADAGMRFAGAVSLVTAMSILGYGPGPPATDWAAMLSENLVGVDLNPSAVVAPACAVALLAISANLAADRLARWWSR